MSTIVWFPGSIAGLKPTSNDGKVSFDADGSIIIDREWKCRYADAFSLCPKPRTAAPEGTPGYNTLCISSGYERFRPDGAIVRATYQGIWNMPFTVYEMDASRYERPIQYHPDFNDASKFPVASKIMKGVTDPNTGATVLVFDRFKDICDTANDDSCKFRGVEAYMVPSGTFRKTSYTTIPDFSLDGVFKIGTPETGGHPIRGGDNVWLKADKTCRNMYRGASQIWEIQETWIYNENGWLTEIYGS